jgi:Bacteriophage tail sheath protein
MTAISYPGVYVTEIPGGARPIEPADTSTAAFVGAAEKGPDAGAVRIDSWDEYRRDFGDFIPRSYLAEGVFSFFNNGGRKCYVVRVTDTNFAAAFQRLNDRNDVSLLAVPGIGTQRMMDLGVAYCESRPRQDIFYVGESGKLDHSVAQAGTFRKSLTKASSYGALYFPWVLARDPSGRTSRPVALPPSGFVAGLYARIDGTRGVWKAPAGTEAGLNGATGLAAELSDAQQAELDPIGVNCLRRRDPGGVFAWGARTLSSDPEWKYVPVRRTEIMIRKSIYDGIQWAVFEPNDRRLWASLRAGIGAFMSGLFRAGAFQGAKASDAYFVRCGLGDTMTQDDIDRGQVIVLVGFAPLKPAEFVIVRIQQKAGQ